MKFYNSFFILCFLAVMVACSTNETYLGEKRIEWDDFEEIELKGEVLSFSEEIMNPYHLIVRDSFLLTMNERTENICHVFNLNTKEKVCEQIMMGQGPNDMIHPFFIETEDSFMLYAPMTSSVFTYSWEEFVRGVKVNPTSKKKLSESGFFSELSMLEENLIVVSERPDAPCYVFGLKGDKVGTFGGYPVGPREYSDLEKVDAYKGILATNKKDRVAFCCTFTDLIDFYDAKGKLISRLHGPEHFYTSFIEFNNEMMMGSRPDGNYYRDAFYSPFGGEKYLYVLFNGKFVNRPGYDLLAQDILVFDWDGNPVCRYKLDMGVSKITIDESNRIIYGISNKPEYHIVEFKY